MAEVAVEKERLEQQAQQLAAAEAAAQAAQRRGEASLQEARELYEQARPPLCSGTWAKAG